LAARMVDYTPQPGWQTPQARVIESGNPMLLSDVSGQQQEPTAYDTSHAEVLRAAGIRSLMVVPLSARGRTFGCITLAAAESARRYSPVDLRLALDLANRAAMAADNSRLYDETRQANEQLRIAEARSSGIVSISADAIISVDEALRITMWNDGAEKIFGYSR